MKRIKIAGWVIVAIVLLLSVLNFTIAKASPAAFANSVNLRNSFVGLFHGDLGFWLKGDLVTDCFPINENRNLGGQRMMMSQSNTPPAHVGMLQLLNGASVAGAVSCLAQPGIPDLVEAGPKSAEELAGQIGAHAPSLYRLMRATASVGVLLEGPDGKFSETPMSAVLRSNASPSLRALAVMGGREWHGRAWSRLEYCVRTGKAAIDQMFGVPVFEYLKQHPEEAQIFNDAMTGLSMIDSPAVAEAYNFGLCTRIRKDPHFRLLSEE